MPAFRSRKLLLCITCAAVAVFAAFGSVVAHATDAPMESITVEGLAHPVDILIDHWGVPHIFADNESDAFFVQGFNAARDRLFQIDLWRRRGLGQLGEVFGPAYVEQDKATLSGESGDPDSPHYRDLAQMWLDGCGRKRNAQSALEPCAQVFVYSAPRTLNQKLPKKPRAATMQNGATSSAW